MTNEKHTIAGTIFAQLGGNKFVAMTGAKNFDYCDRYLRFQLPRGAKNKAKFVKIALEINDTYTVTFSTMKRSTYEVVVISTHEMIFADRLQTLFTEQTGLDCTLGWNDGPFK